MADDNTIIEGTVKFRDGKKWKSRWCVMRKLSPVADCVQLQLYRDARARGAGASSKAALSLAHYLGCESGFTLDKHSHTLALVCRDLVAVLAFETRERLIQWQVKVQMQLGEAPQYLVLVSGRRARGPARLHVTPGRAALTAGVPPRLAGLWELQHLRRYGVVEGRFCFEGGSLCGKGEGLHVLVTDRARDIERDFELAAQGRTSPRRRSVAARKHTGADSPKSQKSYRPDTRLSELSPAERAAPPRDLALRDATPDEEAGAGGALGLGDTASVRGEDAAPAGVALERCRSCMSKLGALSRSSTAALTPGATHFSPAWTMEAVPEPEPAAAPGAPAPACPCDRPPDRPPKPTHLELGASGKPPAPLPAHSCHCMPGAALDDDGFSRVGPYENYDVPKLPSAEVDGEYYDTPKRLKDCLGDELFKITRSSTPSALILQKPCGCLLKFGRRRKEPTVVDAEESLQPPSCPCRRVTDWANSWIRLPYCRRNTASSESSVPNKENVMPNVDRNALYATIDVSRKTKRKTCPDRPPDASCDTRRVDIDEGPLANYENLNFALSLEHYENAKDLLRRAGVTQAELDAIGANLRPYSLAGVNGGSVCARCGHPPRPARARAATDEYLVMQPNALERAPVGAAPAGYTPMSPVGAFRSLRHPPRLARALLEKSASNPTLCAPPRAAPAGDDAAAPRDRVELRKRSSSADSSRFLDDVEEFEGGAASRGSASSLETLRDAARSPPPAPRPAPAAPCAARCRDSSSSNDSGVSSCSRRRPARRARSHDPPAPHVRRDDKSSSAEAEVPVLGARPPRGVADTHSTSSGASDMSDYIETLSICSSHSSTDTPITMRQTAGGAGAGALRHATSTLRPRSGAEYQSLDARLASSLRRPRGAGPGHLYTNLP